MAARDASLIALGSINLDLQVRGERWPEPGETMLVGELLRVGGGKAANRAVLARRLGARARLIGRVGEDDFAGEALAGPRAEGVDVSAVLRSSGATGLAMIVVRPDGEKTILLAPNANEQWEAQDVARAAAAVSAASEGSVLTIDLEVPAEILMGAARAGRGRGFKIVLDPSPGDRMVDELYELVDVLTPNPVEAQRLTGVTVKDVRGARRAGEALRERGARAACVKLPDGGCVVVSEEVCETIAAVEVARVVDKTGAGDAFAGALAVGLLEGATLVAAARMAVAAASLAVTEYGSQAGYPDRGRLDQVVAGRGTGT
jgi:ribokinase